MDATVRKHFASLQRARSIRNRTYPLSRIEDAYELFENKKDGVIKVAVEC